MIARSAVKNEEAMRAAGHRLPAILQQYYTRAKNRSRRSGIRPHESMIGQAAATAHASGDRAGPLAMTGRPAEKRTRTG
jgi:hypothetical protein